MIDSISVFYESSDYLELNKAKLSLQNSDEKVNRVTGEIMTFGNLGNLKVSILPNGISVKGSICKYYFGDNLQQLKRKTIKTAIENLCDELHLNISSARLYKVDISSNISLKRELSNYTNCFGSLQYFSKNTFNNNDTLLYKNKLKEIEFYDKIQEMQCKKSDIPIDFHNSNILRYELRINKRLKGTIKKEKPVLTDLYDEKTYINLIDLWKKFYFLIYKYNSVTLNKDFLKMLNVKHLKYGLMLLGLHSIGEKEFDEILKSARKENMIDKNQYYSLKREINKIAKMPKLTEKNDSIIELDEKVNQCAMYYR